MKNNNSPVPVLMYHSVGTNNPNWIWSYLTIGYQLFDQQMRYLKKKGCNTISLSELYAYMLNGEAIPPNSLVLTFDDGYLDNWVAVSPILKKYGFRGTVYVNPEFVDPCDKIRPTLDDLWSGNISEQEIEWHGFLSWAEMIELEKDGTLEIQSHAMTHTWYFSSDEIIDFENPGDEYVWMRWNRNIELKYSYLNSDFERKEYYGTPVYKHGKSLAIRRYIPEPNVETIVREYVKKKGGLNYFEKHHDWKKELMEISDKAIKQEGAGRYETDEEYAERIDFELKQSKKIIEENLGKNIEYLCWPGGGYTDITVKKALGVYKSVTLGSSDKTGKKNVPGDKPGTIKRMGIPYVCRRNDANYSTIRYLNGASLYQHIKTFQGNKINNYYRKALKGINLISLYIR